MLRVVTDSGADLPAELAAELGITVVPATVVIGDRALLDGVEITPAEVLAALERGDAPSTSLPSPGAFTEAYTKLVGDGATEILSIHFSSKQSGTFEAARAGAANVNGAIIEHIDSAQISGSVALAAMAAAEAAVAGAGLAEACARVEDQLRRTRTFVLVDTLEYLRRGGRMTRGAELVGTLLKVKPLLVVEDGALAPLARVRTMRAAIADIARRCAALPPIRSLFVLDASAPDHRRLLLDALTTVAPDAQVWTAPIGAAISVHVGPGALILGVVTA